MAKKGLIYWAVFFLVFRWWWNFWEKDLGQDAYEGKQPNYPPKDGWR